MSLKPKCWSCWRSVCTYPICWCGSEDLEVIDDGRHIDTSLVIETMPSISPGSLEVIQLTAMQELQSTLDRRRLHYADSLGKGWFGWVIRGRYQGTEVIVQSLREEASAKDQKRFIEMALSAYRARDHPNVLRLIGTSMDHPPYLIALESCEAGNLKTFLANAQGQIDVQSQDGRRLILSLCKDVSNGVAHLHHQANVIPNDLGARTCQITSQLIVKIGDYGLAKTLHPEDYLAADPSTTSNHSLTSQTNTDEEFKNRFQPLRWLSPETLGSIVKEPSATSSGGSLSITRQESIWSLGITLWEMCYLCQKQPFDQIADQLFLQASLIHSNLTLPPINIKGVEGEALQSVINMCVKGDPTQRMVSDRLSRYLNDVYECIPAAASE